MIEPNHEDSSSSGSDNEVEKKGTGANPPDRGCRQESKKRKETQKRSTAAGVFENARTA